MHSSKAEEGVDSSDLYGNKVNIGQASAPGQNELPGIFYIFINITEQTLIPLFLYVLPSYSYVYALSIVVRCPCQAYIGY